MSPDPPAAHAADTADVVREFATDPVLGLTTDGALERLSDAGPNALQARDPIRPSRIVFAQATSPILLLLIGAGVLSAALGDIAEAIVIAVVVVLNVWIGFRQEYSAVQAMARLQSLAAPTVTAIRDGRAAELPATDVVPGDLVVLDAGARVPADGRLVEAHALQVDESALTGESVPVEKQTDPVRASAPLAERASMAFSGTSVTAGRGRLVVTATGMSTELGGVADLLDTADPGRTPLQQRLDTLVRNLSLAAGGIVLLVTVLGLIRDEPLETLLLTAVSLAVAAVPESLPAVVTVTLGLGAQRMLTRRSLIRRLYAVETLGSVTTICSDKTGTLTQNQMTIVVLDTAGTRRVLASEHHHAEELADDPTLALLLTAGTLCNDTTVASDNTLLGDPTETALVTVADRYGLRKRDLEQHLPRETELPFDSSRKRMTTVHRLDGASDLPATLSAALTDGGGEPGGDDQVAFTKGAIDGLLPHCTQVTVDGVLVPFDDALRARVAAASEQLASEGLRVLGVGFHRWPAGQPVPVDESLESGLTFVGLFGMIDPARPEANEAIATCRDAGMQAVMITGDHPLTAAAIGRSLGLVGEQDTVLTGAQLAAMDADELRAAVPTTAIYARVSPADKLQIVSALQASGQVVAMTGDGVNDAPALKQADIGVAMGITGTDVTKDAADMVLLDDDFATIVRAVREGRVVFDNIRKFIRNILSGNVAEVSAMVLGPLLGMPIPLLPLQILWLNLVTDGLPAMAMAVERPEPDVMRRPPTPLAASLLGDDRGRRILSRGAMLTVLTFIPTYLLWDAGDEAWQTVLFTSLAFAELAGGFAMRSESVPLWRLGLFSNRAMVVAVGFTVALQVLLVAVPPARDVLGLTSLTAGHWLLIVGIALAYAAAVELDKAITARRGR